MSSHSVAGVAAAGAEGAGEAEEAVVVGFLGGVEAAVPRDPRRVAHPRTTVQHNPLNGPPNLPIAPTSVVAIDPHSRSTVPMSVVATLEEGIGLETSRRPVIVRKLVAGLSSLAIVPLNFPPTGPTSGETREPIVPPNFRPIGPG